MQAETEQGTAGPAGAWVRPVSSRAITHLGYDAAERALLVRFTSGEAYVYADVPPAVVERFLAAPSKGRFFREAVLDRFRFVRAEG